MIWANVKRQPRDVQQLEQLSTENITLRSEILQAREDRNEKVADVVRLTDELNRLRGEQRTLVARQDQLIQLVTEYKHTLDVHDIKPTDDPNAQPYKVDGIVTDVADELIEISIGEDDGLKKNHTLEVYRDNVYLGQAVVLKVTPDRAVARIVPELKQGIIKRGDRVSAELSSPTQARHEHLYGHADYRHGECRHRDVPVVVGAEGGLPANSRCTTRRSAAAAPRRSSCHRNTSLIRTTKFKRAKASRQTRARFFVRITRLMGASSLRTATRCNLQAWGRARGVAQRTPRVARRRHPEKDRWNRLVSLRLEAITSAFFERAFPHLARKESPCPSSFPPKRREWLSRDHGPRAA